MSATVVPLGPVSQSSQEVKHRKTPWNNLLVGAVMNMFQVTSLGQPMEVLKTHIAANRNDSLKDALRKTWARGGVPAFYQGLIPWVEAWIECSTKGSILFITTNEVEYYSKAYLDSSPPVAGALGGVAGGAAQSYLTMGMTTCMKTVEVTRHKSAAPGARIPGTLETFMAIVRKEGIRGVNRGVNAVALRQISGWSSRIGISRLAEGQIKTITGKPADTKLSIGDRIAASTIGGALSCWNQPFEVLRVEMQSLSSTRDHATKPTMASAAKHIFKNDGLKGFFRGIVPRIGVASWATICMVGFGDTVRAYINKE